MQITTVHTLSFSIKGLTPEQQAAAAAIIKTGAATMGLTVVISNLPLLEEDDHGNRNSVVKASASDFEVCSNYWVEVSRALTLIGVDSTSP